MELIWFYSLRNMLARRMTSVLTAGGMALVVFVFTAIIMLAEGLEKTLVDTGSPGNALVIRRSSESEVQSGVSRAEAGIVVTEPEVALGPDARPLAARELVVLIVLDKPGGTKANVPIRGIEAASLALRPQVRLLAGRPPAPGSTEIMVGSAVARGFSGVGLGSVLSFAGRKWRVTGIFDAGRTGFSSEIWGDVEQLMSAFRRQAYSLVVFTMRDPASFGALKARIESDPRLTLEVWRENEFYRKQSEMLATFLRILGISLTVIFSIGAVVGAMITMYAAVAGRVAEIGTLRALGFGRRTILGAFLLESLMLGLLGGLAGLGLAALLQFFTVSTTNFQTFSELAFRFALTPKAVGQALAFALVMGLAGGLPPAVRAARMNLIEALREA